MVQQGANQRLEVAEQPEVRWTSGAQSQGGPWRGGSLDPAIDGWFFHGRREIWAGCVGFLPVFFLPPGKAGKEKKKQEAGSTIVLDFFERHQKQCVILVPGCYLCYFEKICEAELEVESSCFCLAKWIPLPLWTVRFSFNG